MNFLRVGFDIGTVSGMRYPTGSMKPSRAAAALQPVLEKSRLELRALFRTLDRLHLAQELPAELRVLLEVDADFAEALHVLKQAPRNIDWGAMERDTRASLARVSVVREALLATFDATRESFWRPEQKRCAGTCRRRRPTATFPKDRRSPWSPR